MSLFHGKSLSLQAKCGMSMGKKIVFLFILLCFYIAVDAAAAKQFVLVIDAGHGGHDAGAKGSFSYEKNINLNVALAFGRYVERDCKDVKVVYTRKTDVFVPLHVRADIANKNHADLFVSIHTNALPKGRISRGMETYTLGMHRAADNLDVAKRENSVILVEKDYRQRYEGFDPRSSESYIMFEFMQDKNMAKSVDLARFVQQRTCALANRQDKGVKQAGFLVLRETSMPSCLIELGFITTPDEERFLNSNTGIDAMGRGIYRAFLDYKRKYHGGINVPYEPGKETNEPIAEEKSSEEEMPTHSDTATPAGTQKAEVPAETNSEVPTIAPVFKVQIVTSGRKLSAGDKQFKGESNVDSYVEGGIYKYTIGASADYNEIYRQRKKLMVKFPQAFIVAFKNGVRMDINEAIREFKANRKDTNNN